MSKRKKYSPFTPQELDGSTTSVSSIQLKLSTLMSDVDLDAYRSLFHEINIKVHNLSRTVNEAYVLANLYVRRCIELDKPILKLTGAFFKTCCGLVSGGSTRDRKDATKQTLIDDLNETFEQDYLPLRPTDHRPILNKAQTQCRSILGIEMATMTKNFYVMHFRRYLFRYIKVFYGLKEKEISPYQFLRPIFPDGDDKKPPSELSSEQLEVKVLYGERNIFLDSDIECNLEFYIRRLHEIRVYLERRDQEERAKEELERAQQPVVIVQSSEKKKRKNKSGRRKAFRLISLLPLKGDWVLSFMSLDHLALLELLNVLPEEIQRKIVRLLKGVFYNNQSMTEFLNSKLEPKKRSNSSIFDERFVTDQGLKRALWDTLFNIKKLETCNRRFDFRIATNGYAVTVQMARLKPKEDEESKKRKKPTTTLKKDDGEFDPMPQDTSEFTKFIGVDPGSNYLYTCYEGMRDDHDKSLHKQASAEEYRHLAWMNARTSREKRLRKQEPHYNEIIQELSNHSLKVSGFEQLKINIKATLKHEWYLFDFCRQHPYRKWRFTINVNTPNAMFALIRKMIGNVKDEKVLIGFGDWSEQACLKGKPKAPVKKFRRELRRFEKRVTLVKIDEYCTSKTCSGCHGENGEMKYNQKECREVLKCKTCNTYWQRDCNASVNMFGLLNCLMKGQERPEAMKRSSQEVKVKKTRIKRIKTVVERNQNSV